MPLTSLASQVEAFASYCLPDYVYTTENTRDLAFTELDLGPFVGHDRPLNVAALAMTDEGRWPYAFTLWSRSQLLAHLGTREKWFETVTRAQEVSELNIRLHALRRFTFRTMRSFDSPDLRMVRGIVSAEYADLPDTIIMKSLAELAPEGLVVRSYSGKTDRAFYAYIITGDRVGIPGTSFFGFPGIVVKNSEVGFTSLWVIPMLYLPHYGRGVPLVMKRHTVLQRIHRGDIAKLTEKFAEALEKTKALWGPLETKLAKLRSITFATEDDAVEAIRRMLESVGARRYFIFASEQAYRSAQHVVHDAFGVFEAVLVNVQKEDDKDRAYVSTELAGAVLLQLLK